MDTMTLQQNISPSIQTASVTYNTSSSQSVTHTEDLATTQTQTLQQNPNRDDLSQDEQNKIIQESVEEFNKMSDSLDLDVKFAYNDKIDQIYLNVIDKNTGQTIRKLPSEEAMKIAESMKDLVGALFDKKG